MEHDFENLDKSISFFRIPILGLQVPKRFVSAAWEQEYMKLHEASRARFLVLAVFITLAGTITPLIADLSDIASVLRGHAAPWNHVVVWSHLTVIMLMLSVATISFFRPRFLTKGRRLCLSLVVFSAYQAFNRDMSVAYFTSEWPYKMERLGTPFGAALVPLTQTFVTFCCSSAVAQASQSLVVCLYAVFLTLVFNLAAVPSGSQTVGLSFFLAFIVSVQATTVFSAHVAAELSERRAFLLMWEFRKAFVQERTRRYSAERHAEQIAKVSNAQRAKAQSDALSENDGSRFSSEVFDLLHRVDPHVKELVNTCEFTSHAIADLGDDERWLIHAEDLTLYPDLVLGAGGYGSVVAGSWKLAPVAVKVPKQRTRGEHHPLALELRHFRKLRHPCIVSFFGLCIESNTLEMVLVEEYICGQNLRDFVRLYDKCVVENTRFRWQVLVDISAALHYLHSQSPAIVHGDLKPNNILIEGHTLTAKITDFGLARRCLTRDVTPGGTLYWLAPACRADPHGQEVRCSADMWAYGAVAFFLSTGVGPWNGLVIAGSDGMKDFGAAVFNLWHGVRPGDQVQGIAASELNQLPRRVLPHLEDLQDLSILCCRCMSVEDHERPTAKLVHDEALESHDFDDVRWRKAACKKNQQREQSTLTASATFSLYEQIQSVRAALSSTQASAANAREPVYPSHVLKAAMSVLSELAMKVQQEKYFQDHNLKSIPVLQALLCMLGSQESSSKQAKQAITL
eukprot:TRINITY_DN3289_c0_g1_i1.p1 TRINITY_DN3289_c0_g1~~TRINITY_DN3289_c0_g1_i1.p1  ORF type:complete len:760 (-),score=55.40 TRINITY_DN3289_c0_g1_i1:51-2267(-)